MHSKKLNILTSNESQWFADTILGLAGSCEVLKME